MEFLDRRDAGRRLAAQLAPLAAEQPVVIGLPRGGVPVAAEVARALGVPLEVLAVRKLGAPANPEYAVGAIAEDGTQVLDDAAIRRIGMSAEEVEATVAREVAELHRRVVRYRGRRPPPDVRGRTVIVVDDGIATGLTDLAAVRALRGLGARRIVVAVPVGAAESIAMLGAEADEIVCHTIPHELVGVGRWYRDFSPVADDEVLALLARARTPPRAGGGGTLALALEDVTLAGDLRVPANACGLVIFAHGSGSSRLSPRNRAVAARLADAGLATILFDLLTEHEGHRRELLFDIALLADRLEGVTRWALAHEGTAGLPIGYFGASTGAAAALRAAAALPDVVRAIVARGGRPDLAADHLPAVRAATLLIVGALDATVLDLNRAAAAALRCERRLVVLDGADHLFTAPGALDEVARLATGWLRGHLAGRRN